MNIPPSPPTAGAILRKLLVFGIYGLMAVATLAWLVGGCFGTMRAYPGLANLRGGYSGVFPAAVMTGFRDPTFFLMLAAMPLVVLRLAVGIAGILSTPQEAIARPGFNWRWLCIRGMWLAGGSFIAVGIMGAISQRLETTAAIMLSVAMLPLMAIFAVGLLMALVGGMVLYFKMPK